MKKVRIAINGFGRIGRSVLRALYESGRNLQIELVAINELADPKAIAHLLKYDSSHGRFQFTVSVVGNGLQIEDNQIELMAESDPRKINWGSRQVDLVLDCTGVFHSREHAGWYLKHGAKKVLFSHPADSDVDATVIYGVNHHQLSADDCIVSNGSCTTNCIVPVIETLDRTFGVKCGSITTIHSSMNDQQVIDAFHHDFHLSRAAGTSIIPVKTGLARGIVRILPKFMGKFEAIAVRVPTQNVTAMDLSVTLCKKVTVSDVNQAMLGATKGTLEGILDYTEEPLVSVDFNHNSHSSIVDGTQTRVSGADLVKVLAWCDNEWGFANRMLDTAQYMAHL